LASADHDQHLRPGRHETTGEAGEMRQQKTLAATPRGYSVPTGIADGLAEILRSPSAALADRDLLRPRLRQ
jgi:hypothetical protein